MKRTGRRSQRIPSVHPERMGSHHRTNPGGRPKAGRACDATGPPRRLRCLPSGSECGPKSAAGQLSGERRTMGRGAPKTSGRITTAGGAAGAPATGGQEGIRKTGRSVTTTGRSSCGSGNPSTTTPSIRTHHTRTEAMAEHSPAVNFQLGRCPATTPSWTYRPGSPGATATSGTTSTISENSPTCVGSTARRSPVRRGHSLHCLRHRPLQALSATHRLPL